MQTYKRIPPLWRVVILLDILALLAVLWFFAVYASPGAKANALEQPVCQYPTRPLNQDGSCDNSDPCDPSTIKDPELHGDCGPCAGYPGGKCESCTLPNSCTGKDATPPDPDRPYYDQYGNKYDYMGNLIEYGPETTPAEGWGK